jgi:5-amino-6-(5-phosphoribosylamino)uracil reductase
MSSEPQSRALLEPLDASGERISAIELTDRLGLWERPSEPPSRPLVRLNMIATADGRATLSGKSGPLSAAADRQLFHALRATADAVLAGAGTVRAERYGRLLPDASLREERERRGLSPEPLACVVSGRLMLPEDLPLLRQPDTGVVLLTTSEASLPELGAQVDYVRTPGPPLDLPAALAELTSRFAVTSVLCEGGPHLAWQLLDAGLLDEIFLTIAPLLAGGDPSGGEALRMLAGGELDPPARLDLLKALRGESYLFLRYAVTSPGPRGGPQE